MRANNLSLLVLLGVLVTGLAFGQPLDYDKDYNLAKASLSSENYDAAFKGFTTLMNSDPANPRALYTMYYRAISAYFLGRKEVARDLFLQIGKNNQLWDKVDDTNLWLSKIHFELNSPNQGMYYANKVEEEASLVLLATDLKRAYLTLLDQATLSALLVEHEDALIAEFLVLKMMQVSYEEREDAKLDSLISYYKLALIKPEIPDDIFREKYKVAVMLPLFSDRLWASGIYLQKSLAVDIYEGIQMALNEFDSTKISVEVFDTKKDSLTTSNLLASGQLDSVDAIIGPLYPKPIKLLAKYAFKHRTNYINPVSTNSQLVEKNPYAFLLRTGGQSIGKLMAGFARNEFDTKTCAIYYGPRLSDSLAAFNYAEQMLSDSFHIVIMQRTRTVNARELFDSLTSSIQVVDTVELQRMWDEGEQVQFMPMRDSLRLKVDSIGHIFIASDNKAIAAEVMAAITSRGDSTQIIGLGNWFSEANASLDVMEELGVWLVMQEYEDMLQPNNIRIRNSYLVQYHKKPSKYFYYGYYAMRFIGQSLMEHGAYFQNGMKNETERQDWFDFRASQDNKRMVIIQLNNGVTERVIGRNTQ